MAKNVTLTLIENSTAGNAPKIFPAQDIDITHQDDTVRTGVDGKVSRARHDSTILWRGGKAADLKNITDVKIAAKDGTALIDGQLNRNFGAPHDVDGGVEFFVLRPDDP